jgi:hypothetical protein
VLAVEPEAVAERARNAHADRTLDWWPLADGMAELRLIASATDVMAVYHAADAIAQTMRATIPGPGVQGFTPVAALRADALIDLATGGAAAARAPAVNVTIDLPTLLGLQDHPGELAGYGPLPAPLARRWPPMAAGAGRSSTWSAGSTALTRTGLSLSSVSMRTT